MGAFYHVYALDQNDLFGVPSHGLPTFALGVEQSSLCVAKRGQ